MTYANCVVARVLETLLPALIYGAVTLRAIAPLLPQKVHFSRLNI